MRIRSRNPLLVAWSQVAGDLEVEPARNGRADESSVAVSAALRKRKVSYRARHGEGEDGISPNSRYLSIRNDGFITGSRTEAAAMICVVKTSPGMLRCTPKPSPGDGNPKDFTKTYGLSSGELCPDFSLSLAISFI